VAVAARRQNAPVWNADRVKALREHLGYTQRRLADELGTRQQTISEWETGQYRPRGASARLLTLVAERADFPYSVEAGPPAGESEADA
jgi:DNA-binding transcriptional regulator YiaG